MGEKPWIAVGCRWQGRLEEAPFAWSLQGEVFLQHDAWLRNMDMSKCGLASLQAANVSQAAFLADLKNARVRECFCCDVLLHVGSQIHSACASPLMAAACSVLLELFYGRVTVYSASNASDEIDLKTCEVLRYDSSLHHLAESGTAG